MKKSIKLDVPERLLLSDVIVNLKYNRALLQQAEDFMKKLAFTKEEMKLFGISSAGTSTQWAKNTSIQFHVPEDVVEKVLKHFESLLDREQMTLQLKSLYDKFLKLKQKG